VQVVGIGWRRGNTCERNARAGGREQKKAGKWRVAECWGGEGEE